MQGICEWRTKGGVRCKQPGEVSPMTGQGAWYCSFHFSCLSDPRLADYPEAEQEFYAKRIKESRQRPKLDGPWDPDDPLISKGLRFLGEDSLAWKRAPVACQAAALASTGTKGKMASNLSTKPRACAETGVPCDERTRGGTEGYPKKIGGLVGQHSEPLELFEEEDSTW